ALARQEGQLATHLEDKRRQLLELQDQITEARSALRQKRAAHAELAGRQQHELAQARAEAADLQGAARAERQRLLALRRRMLRRWRRPKLAHPPGIQAQEATLQRQRDPLPPPPPP